MATGRRNTARTFDEMLAAEHAWTAADIGRNAISGLLNDPPSLATIPFGFLLPRTGLKESLSVPPTLFRRVLQHEFDPYLRAIEPVIDRFHLNRVLGVAAVDGVPLLGVAVDDLDHELAGNRPVIDKYLHGIADNSLAHKSPNKRERARILSAKPLPAKDTIPSVFAANFSLRNQLTFNEAVGARTVTAPAAADGVSPNKTLRDQLTHYADTAEIHLLQEISRRSSSFFEALTHLKSLQLETESCVEKIATLKDKINGLSDVAATKGLEVVRIRRRRGNIAALFESVKVLSELKETHPFIQEMLIHADYVGALDALDKAGRIIHGKHKTGVADIVEVICPGIQLIKTSSIIPENFKIGQTASNLGITQKLFDAQGDVEYTMVQEFLAIILKDLNANVPGMINEAQSIKTAGFKSTSFAQTPVFGWMKNIVTENFTASPGLATGMSAVNIMAPRYDNLKDSLVQNVRGLLRMDVYCSALSDYKQVVIGMIKTMMNQLYPVMVKKATLEESATEKLDRKKENQVELNKNLRAMSFTEYYELIGKVYVLILALIQRAANINELLTEIAVQAKDTGLVFGIQRIEIQDLGAQRAIGAKLHPEKIRRRMDTEDFDDMGSIQDITSDDSLQKQQAEPPLPKTPIEQGTPSTLAQILQETSDVLFSVIEFSHIRCAKLFTIRADQNVKLHTPDFFRLFGASLEFLNASESLCGKMCYTLKGCVLSQAKLYVNGFHEEKMRQVISLLEVEPWVQAEIPMEFSHIAAQLQLTKSQKSASLTSLERQSLSSDIGAEVDDEMDLTMAGAQMKQSLMGSNVDLVDPKKIFKFLVVDSDKYYAVGSVLLFLKTLTDYVVMAEKLQPIAPEVINRICELLKLYNSRVCQLVLGAGALRSAGLKNISARNIGIMLTYTVLAAQSIGLIIAMIPYIKTGMAQLLPVKQHAILNTFDKISGDFRDHQNELYLKLVGIMTDRFVIHSQNMLAINWDTPDPKDFPKVDSCSIHMDALVKETSALHAVISKYLPPAPLNSIFTQVLREYTRKLDSGFQGIDLFSSAGKNRLMIEAQFLISSLSALEGIDGPGGHLEVCVNNIKIKDRRTWVPAPRPSPGVPKPPPPTPPVPPQKSSYSFGNFGTRK